jgi:hypothetical protein
MINFVLFTSGIVLWQILDFSPKLMRPLAMGVFILYLFVFIYAEVVTFVAGSLEAGGLPGSLEIPEVLK